MLEKSGQADLPFVCHIPSVPIRVIRGEFSLSSDFNRRFRVCAGEAGSHVGESPTGRIRRFTTERDVRKEAARLNLQAGHLLNQQAITKVNSIQ
jgi:hypothetical protein